MSNFSFLQTIPAYALFAPACVEAEKIYASAPALCAVGCRKALELAVRWVYAADNTMRMPYKDNLQSLIHEESFREAVDGQTWGKLPFIIKLGNLAVHTERSVQPGDALASLRSLFEFVQWIDYCYGADYVERTFDERLIPMEKVAVDTRKIKEQESLLEEKEAQIEALRKQIEQMAAQYTAEKDKHQQERTFQPEDLSEFKTRKIYIDVDMKQMGWKFDGTDVDVQEEYKVEGMAGVPGQPGYCDYVLFGKDGFPLPVEREAAFLEGQRQKERSILVLGFAGEELVCVASCDALTARERVAHRASVSLTVARDYWGQGIGRGVMEALIAFARQTGLEVLQLEVRSDNTRAVALYEHLGFEKLGLYRDFMKVNGQGFDAWYMNLYL